jgi:hypothetical protein
MEQIFYKEGYKYQLTRDYSCYTGILLPQDVVYDFFTLTADGWCHLRKGFAWDGASGPTWDTKSSMRPSAVHDAYCQAAQDRLIDYETYAPQYNEVFHRMCLEDQMLPPRAWVWKKGVEIGEGGNPNNYNGNPELCAPKGCA